MKLTNKDFENVKEAFSNCRPQSGSIKVSAGWQQRVMQDVRSIEPLKQKTDTPYDLLSQLLEGIHHHFWSIAPVACAFILFLSILVAKIDIGTEYELNQFFYETQSENSLYQSLNFDES